MQQPKTLTQHIETIIEEFDKKWYQHDSDIREDYGWTMKEIRDFLKSKLTLIAETTREAVKVEKKSEFCVCGPFDRCDCSKTGYGVIDTQEANWKTFNQ